MLHLPDCWVWDSWYVDDGHRYHAFYLKASRALLDPNRRHRRASVGHSISPDLVTWTEVTDALVPADQPAFDDLAIWTGSIVRSGGEWRFYYTGISRADDGLVQRIGLATSPELLTWQRYNRNPIVTADHRWYGSRSEGSSNDEAWRDPWVFQISDGWHMLITARSNTGPVETRGVVAHARSDDGIEWTVTEPLAQPGHNFSQLEVNQVVEIDGRWVLIFCCGHRELSLDWQSRGEEGGIFAINASGPLGPFDTSAAYRLTGADLYAGRLVHMRNGEWVLLAFADRDRTGAFGGVICDPHPVGWNADGRLAILT